MILRKELIQKDMNLAVKRSTRVHGVTWLKDPRFVELIYSVNPNDVDVGCLHFYWLKEGDNVPFSGQLIGMNNGVYLFIQLELFPGNKGNMSGEDRTRLLTHFNLGQAMWNLECSVIWSGVK